MHHTIKRVFGPAAFALLAGQASAAPIFPLIVDSFNLTGQVLTVGLGDSNVQQAADDSGSNVNTALAEEALGFFRTLGLVVTGDVGTRGSATADVSIDQASGVANSPANAPGLLVTSTSDVTSDTTVRWDGNAQGIQKFGEFDGDITGAGAYNGVVVTVPTPTEGALSMTLRMVSGSSGGPEFVWLPLMLADEGFGELFFSFEDFDDSANGFDPTNLYLIELIVQELEVALSVPGLESNLAVASTQPGPFSVLISSVMATTRDPTMPVPLPATLPLLLVGLAGIQLANRWRTLSSC